MSEATGVLSGKEIAVLLPCYNEALTIRNVVEKFREVLPLAVIYVYDNHSSDNTTEEARLAGAVVHTVRWPGKGCVVRECFLILMLISALWLMAMIRTIQRLRPE